jgi:hypothetical protein
MTYDPYKKIVYWSEEDKIDLHKQDGSSLPKPKETVVLEVV